MNLKTRLAKLESTAGIKQQHSIILFGDDSLKEAKRVQGLQDVPDSEITVIRFVGVKP